MNSVSPRTVRLGYRLKAVWAITPKPMLLRWRILIESVTSSSCWPVSFSISCSIPATSSSALSLWPWMNCQRALGDVAADQQDAEAEDGAEPEGQSPAEVGGEPV